MVGVEFDAVLALPFAAVGVRVSGDAIAEIAFLPVGTEASPPSSALAAQACAQIRAYVEDPESPIELPLLIKGTAFQRRVWAAIAQIPVGSTRAYGELAQQLGSTARALGQACGDNRLPLAIPCHRVVAARGIGGFAHRTDPLMLDVKHWLLAHESRPEFALTP